MSGKGIATLGGKTAAAQRRNSSRFELAAGKWRVNTSAVERRATEARLGAAHG